MAITIGQADIEGLASQFGISQIDALLAAAAIQQQGPSAAGAQTTGAFVDLSAVPKFQVTDTGLADTDFTITHNLGFTPSIFILLDPGTVPGILYRGSTSPSHADFDSITLRYTGANASIWVGVL